jgi:hypothetical protein
VLKVVVDEVNEVIASDSESACFNSRRERVFATQHSPTLIDKHTYREIESDKTTATVGKTELIQHEKGSYAGQNHKHRFPPE